eukprot:gene2252-5232_t
MRVDWKEDHICEWMCRLACMIAEVAGVQNDEHRAVTIPH